MKKDKRIIRKGTKSFEDIVRTDERYGSNKFWLGPRGRDYYNLLENPKPYQKANLYPDGLASYWIASYMVPKGSTLTIRGRFPYARYCQFALYKPDPLGSFTATSEAFVDHQIIPDEGSLNPYAPGNNRLIKNRCYTIRIVGKNAPKDPKKRIPNTLYAGNANQVSMAYRVYLPDVGRDGSADVGLPEYELTLSNGEVVTEKNFYKNYNKPMTAGIKEGMTAEQWRTLCNNPKNDPNLKPESTPARDPGKVERYFGNQYNMIDVFKPDSVRLNSKPKIETGFGGDPVTLYMMAWISKAFAPILVVRGKMPKFPNTFEEKKGKGLEIMTDWESRYWSVVNCEAPPSGMSNDGLSDMQVPLDKDRNYTIVICSEEDRPETATEENGFAWLDWGDQGEGIKDDLNRKEFGFLVFRFMYNNKKWKYNPEKVTAPGMEEKVMGPYCPRLQYMTHEEFEETFGGESSDDPLEEGLGVFRQALREHVREVLDTGTDSLFKALRPFVSGLFDNSGPVGKLRGEINSLRDLLLDEGEEDEPIAEKRKSKTSKKKKRK